MKGIKAGSMVTVTEYRSGKEIFHNLHGTIFRAYENSACIIVDAADAAPVIKMLGVDRIVASYKKIKETAAKAALDPANAQGTERRIISTWGQGWSIDRIKSTVLRSESTIYRVLKKYGIDPDAPRVKAKKVKPFTIPHLSR
ncbi:hypothetical protein [Loigolactobacillus jiayinensis]|uniref:HTH luxR-type domain-containing protein n=1 Tax=Loigolactobacillus jiayinensis TaxID=2486016 RepID=A0ABW1RG14_9LACO|nr:hypothetical protein [Loigolactobacillus jiayinensis]